MKIIETVYSTEKKTYFMYNRTLRGKVSVCIVEYDDGKRAMGIMIKSESQQHTLFAEARSVQPKMLLAAAKIIHVFMTIVTDEAVRGALLIAGDERHATRDPDLEKISQEYLCQGVTMNEVRNYVAKEILTEKSLNGVEASLRKHGLLKEADVIIPQDFLRPQVFLNELVDRRNSHFEHGTTLTAIPA